MFRLKTLHEENVHNKCLMGLKVLDENPKIVLPAVILKKKISDPQLHQIFKPIRNFFCTFLPI